jgi:tetratricopeptide (TPR) repeat protein
LSAQAPDKRLFVDDVVTALTGSVLTSGDARPVLAEQMKRATEEFDLRTAEAFARALLEALCQDPIDPRRLEALLILGLAHPTILDQHRISLRKEGERLAAMLAAQGQRERAQTLLATIERAAEALDAAAGDASTDASSAAGGAEPARNERDQARIEQLLREADTAAGRGRTAAAIRLLQEVVTLDRDRRDVARMIRDLRWQVEERRLRGRRRWKLAGLTLVLGALAAGLAWRETDVSRRYAALPPSAPGDEAALRARLAAIDEFVARERVWLGMAAALSERTALQREVADLDARASAARAARDAALSRASDLADSARTRGLDLAQRGRFPEALLELRRALEAGGPDWAPRREVEANAAAIAEWIEKNPEGQGPGR